MTADNQTRSKVWLRRVIEVLLVVALIAGIRAWQQRDIVSGAAPSMQGVLLDGKPFSLAAKPAQPVLVYFWATWCPVCRAEQGAIEAIAHDNPNVITVAMQSGSRDEVAKHLGEQGLSFAVVNDPDGRVSAAWGVHAVPASFIVDTDGQIRFVEIGYTTGVGLRLRLWLAAVLG
ncbi:MAG: alkyl hydroperoxide reductase [Gallionellales bacterium RIFCSPLOWO2_02_FULL_57_47]|nr:MAG: alkyl hydroperoxide reductase [Gallionellales bacterium RIFCSPLOWO2_02_FULL_57_47]OGT13075.1 MAG: alkyl hydroperoxide reductase [Gallionellales bacterium RIFCSPHIGHO2_02_FULL_57_16]